MGSKGHCFAAQMDGNHIQRLLALAKEPGVQEATKTSQPQDEATAEVRLARVTRAGERRILGVLKGTWEENPMHKNSPMADTLTGSSLDPRLP